MTWWEKIVTLALYNMQSCLYEINDKKSTKSVAIFKKSTFGFLLMFSTSSISGQNGEQLNREKCFQMWQTSTNSRGSFWMDDWGSINLSCGNCRDSGKFYFHLHLFEAKNSSNLSQSSFISGPFWCCEYTQIIDCERQYLKQLLDNPHTICCVFWPSFWFVLHP